MKSLSLLSTVFAALLMASPGVALAETSGNHAAAQANHATGGVAYSKIGEGGYSGDAMPIKNNNGNGGAANTNGSGSSNATRPSQRNPLLSDNGDVRIGKMIGSDVFNEHDQKIGTVDGVLAGHNGLWAVVSTNKKKVTVPFKDFTFGNAKANGDDKVVLPNYTEAHLNTLPVYNYNATNYNNGKG